MNDKLHKKSLFQCNIDIFHFTCFVVGTINGLKINKSNSTYVSAFIEAFDIEESSIHFALFPPEANVIFIDKTAYEAVINTQEHLAMNLFSEE